MKQGERTKTVVIPEYVKKLDPAFKERHPEYDETAPLCLDIDL